MGEGQVNLARFISHMSLFTGIILKKFTTNLEDYVLLNAEHTVVWRYKNENPDGQRFGLCDVSEPMNQ